MIATLRAAWNRVLAVFGRERLDADLDSEIAFHLQAGIEENLRRGITPEEARRHTWSDSDRELVADRVETQFVGTAVQVADQLERLRDATEADELIVTTITHDHADRVHSYRLLAEEWARR